MRREPDMAWATDDPRVDPWRTLQGVLRAPRDGGRRAAVGPACDWDLVAGLAPQIRPRRTRRTGGLLRRLASVPLAAGAIALLVHFARTPAAPDATLAASAWTAAAPRLRLVLEDAAPLAVAARASAGRGLREDALTLGAFADAANPFLRLVAATPLAPEAALPAPEETFEAVLARRARDSDGLAVGHVAGRDALPTRFGILDLLDLDLVGAPPRACTGLRLRPAPGRAFALDGYVCGPGGSRPEPRSLACLIERLEPDGPAVRTRFAAASAAHPACGSAETTASTRASPAAGPRRSR